jgi:hypothetical protein
MIDIIRKQALKIIDTTYHAGDPTGLISCAP